MVTICEKRGPQGNDQKSEGCSFSPGVILECSWRRNLQCWAHRLGELLPPTMRLRHNPLASRNRRARMATGNRRALRFPREGRTSALAPGPGSFDKMS